MDFSHYSDEPVRMAVDLINSFDAAAGEEKLVDPSDVADFIAAHDGEWCRPDWEPGERDLHEVRALRARLRQVFEAGSEGKAAVVLNEILADVDAVPRLSVHGEAPHLHFESEGGRPARYLGAIAAMGLTDVYVDTSRNRSRLNCSDTCTTRENVAAHRARQRERG
jgi:hypothetical protein